MRKARVLVIDDDPDIIYVLRTQLENEGFEVIDALDGLTGMTKALKEGPDVILLDIMMPGIDGFEVCERLKSKDGTGSIPVVMLTARTEEEDVERAYTCGADSYITKPFSTVEVVSTLRRLTQPALGVDRKWRSSKSLTIEDQDVRDFVDEHLSSLSQWTLLDYFMDNPESWISAHDIVLSHSSSSREAIHKELETMAANSLLEPDSHGSVFRLTEDPELLSRVRAFTDYCQSTDARLKVICMILDKQRR